MKNRKWISWLNIFVYVGLVAPSTVHASFIEATIGTAVVNDATAAYHNPAALTLMKNSQIIGLGSEALFKTRFKGEATQTQTGFTQSGNSSTQTNYYLPSLYLGIPTDKITVGVAVVSNFFNNTLDDNSILRYAKSNNTVKDLDINPAIGMKLNEFISLGIGMSYSHANILLKPITGLSSLGVPDSQSENEASASGWGGDAGILIKPFRSTLVGLNYRSAVAYQFNGSSVIKSNPNFVSNDYQFNFWTPARSVISIAQLITPKLGLMGTVQRIQWSIFDKVIIQGIATQINSQPVILNADVPFHLHDSWLFTVGGQYHINPKWVVRVASTYNQSPGNNHYQIVNGDSIVLGASTGYEICKSVIIDGSYAHAFIKNENIHIYGRNIINGVNEGSRDSISLKLTLNFK